MQVRKARTRKTPIRLNRKDFQINVKLPQHEKDGETSSLPDLDPVSILLQRETLPDIDITNSQDDDEQHSFMNTTGIDDDPLIFTCVKDNNDSSSDVTSTPVRQSDTDTFKYESNDPQNVAPVDVNEVETKERIASCMKDTPLDNISSNDGIQSEITGEGDPGICQGTDSCQTALVDASEVTQETNIEPLIQQTSEPVHLDDEEPDEDETSSGTPEATKVKLSASEWQDIAPSENEGVRKRLTGDWTEKINLKLKHVFPGCVFVFKANQVKRNNSRKRGSPYFRGSAMCKRETCCLKITLTIPEKPNDGDEQVTINVSSRGHIRHTPAAASRALKGKQRVSVAHEARDIGTMTKYYNNVVSYKEDIKAGNLTSVPSGDVIRKAVQECVNKERRDKDMFYELKLLKQAYREDDRDDPKDRYAGYIQYISIDPFAVVCFGQNQIQLLNTLASTNSVDFYLDATGTVMRTLVDQKRPYLYSVVVKPCETPPVSVCDWLSTDHTIPSICHKLMFFMRAVNCSMPNFRPRKAETDWGWALIQSALIAFNSMRVKGYLNVAYRICLGQYDTVELTVIHICAAHMTKTASAALRKCAAKNRELHKFLMNCFVLLCNEVDLQNAKAVFKDVATLLSSETETSVTNEAKERLTERLRNCVEEAEEPLEKDMDDEEYPVTWTEEGEAMEKTIKASSPWFSLFSAISKQNTDKMKDSYIAGTANEYFCPQALEYILDKLMPIYPLWSGLLLGAISRYGKKNSSMNVEVTETRDSNASVEAWFRMVKHDILRGKKRLGLAEIVIKLKGSLNGRIVESIVPEVRTSSKRKRNDNSIDMSQEKWERRTKETGRKNRYQPQKRLKKTRRTRKVSVSDKVTNTASCEKTCDNERDNKGNTNQALEQKEVVKVQGQSAKNATRVTPLVEGKYPPVPRWGSQCQGRILANTCTIDNFLTILYIHTLEYPDTANKFSSWSPRSDVINSLLTCLSLMREHNFVEAKLLWTSTAQGKPVKGQTVDLYGNEYDMFVKSFQDLVKSKITSRCNSSHCPDPYRERILTGCSLSATPPFKAVSNIQTMVNGWIQPVDTVSMVRFSEKGVKDIPEEYVVEDRAEDIDTGISVSNHHCAGKTRHMRTVQSLSPVVILDVNGLTQLKHLPDDIRTYSRELRLAGKLYHLAGVTFHKRMHFVCCILSVQHGWLYYDGMAGVLQDYNSNFMRCYTPQHAIYVA